MAERRQVYQSEKPSGQLDSWKVHRAYRAMAELTRLLVQERSEMELLQEACRIFVQVAGYCMAWIGYIRKDPEKSVIPVAYDGIDRHYVRDLRISWSESSILGRGPTGTAIRTGKPSVVTRISTDPRYAPWRKEALARGYQSSGAFPLRESGQIIGTLNVYAREQDAFDEDEIRTITQLADILSFGIHAFRTAEQERIRAQESGYRAAELEAILDHMLEGVFVCDTNGHIVLANPAGLDLLGARSIPEARNLPWVSEHAFLPRSGDSELPPSGMSALDRALQGETVDHLFERLRPPSKDRDLVVRTTASPIRDEEGNIIGALKVVRDVTDLMEFERLKDEFVSVAAHELKTPVSVVKGYTQVLQRQKSIPPKLRRPLVEIGANADRISRIINDLIDISQAYLHQLSVEYRELDLLELAEEAIRHFPADRSRIRLKSDDRVIVHGDPSRLLQVFKRLIDNAIKYSPQGGRIEIEVMREGKEARVSIADQGVGIPRDRHKRIFERFYRAHTHTPHDFGGLGVGLYLSREIIQRHGGRISFTSREGKGSTFTFTLPLPGGES